MNTSLWQRLQPHVIAIGIFLVVSCLYCFPALQGLVLDQHDVQSWKSMAHQSIQYKEQHGHYPLWSNSMFSGMPATQILMESKYNITIAHLHNLFTLFLPQPISLFFLSCIGFYILCMALRINNLISIFASLAYAFASYNAVITAVGHTTKFASMGYAPAVIAGLVLLTQKRYVLGFVCTLLFITLQFYQNHPQIVYYTMLIAFCLGIAYAIQTIRQEDFLHLGKVAGLALLAGIMGLASYAVNLMPVYDYAKETMRGGRSELTDPNVKNKTENGLDKDYAFMWSYGIAETFTVIVPRIFGGSSPTVVNNEMKSELTPPTKTAEVLAEKTGMPQEQAEQYAMQYSPYWGAQPSTSGAVYFGAVVGILFILGLTFYKGEHKGWILAATILGIVMAWGKNFPALNNFLFDYLPFYNKFRAPSMALVIPQLTFPLMAALGLQAFITEIRISESLKKKFKNFTITSATLAAVLIAMYFVLDYKSANDGMIRENLSNAWLQQLSQGQQPTPDMQAQANDFGASITNALKDDRKSIYGSDLVRTLIFMGLVYGLLWYYNKKSYPVRILLVAVIVLSLVDLIMVANRYLSKDSYIEAPDLEAAFTPHRADLQILQDTSYYRVFDQADPQWFQSARAAVHHNAIGGYHPAKLALYDDLIKNQIAKGNMDVFNMLNTKYFIVTNPADNQPVAQQNPGALGPVWLVKGLRYVNSADEEMAALDHFNPADTAILDKREESKVPFAPVPDSAATIKLVERDNDRLLYQFQSNTSQFAVFSEIYYPRGWTATIDGKAAPIAKVNYVLRGLAIPAGNHSIEFVFAPKSYQTGETISLIVGILSILALLFGIWWEWKNYKKSSAINKA